MHDRDEKTLCSCIKPLLVDETAVNLGVRCCKCGLDAEHRVSEYMSTLTERARTIAVLKRLLELTEGRDRKKVQYALAKYI